MKNLELIFTKNYRKKKYSHKKIKNVKGKLIFELKTDELSGDEIKEIVDVINYVNDNYIKNFPLCINLIINSIKDKLVYIMLECIIYYLLSENKRKIYFRFSFVDTSIWTEGIYYSSLINLLTDNYEEFKSKFKFDILKGHFRRIIEYNCNEDTLSKTAQDIRWFLSNNSICYEDVNNLTEVITEVAGNAIEHSNTDCLIDIDITDSAYTKPNDDKEYYGMNVAIVSFSDVLFYETLEKRLFSDDNCFLRENLPERYETVYEAKKYHENMFDEPRYSDRDFFIISSYQDRISGNDKRATGGTGLTYLINSLAESAEADFCYMMTGNRVLFFIKEYMKYDSDGWIGFNESCNYVSDIPDVKCFSEGRTYIPGTIYNLCFVIRKD